MTSNSVTAKNIFFACSGLGMGNASRLAALMEALSEKSKTEQVSINFKIAAWGAGHEFLSEFRKDSTFDFELIKLNSYPKKRSVTKFCYAFLSNTKNLKQQLRKASPDVIILDSDYHWPAYLFSPAPKVFIGQAIDVIERAITRKYKFKNLIEKMNMFFKERLDAFYQLIVSDLVIVPAFQKDISENTKVRKVSLIVRNEFLKDKVERNNESNRIAVLLSGSEIEKEAFLKLESHHNIKVFTPSHAGKSFLSHSDALDNFDIIFTQGGLTSISEVVARKIFLVVFPINNHPEQVLNAIEIESLGLGIKATLDDLKNFQTFSESIIKNRKHVRANELKCSGASESAALVMNILNQA